MLGINYGTSSNASLLGNFEIVATTLIALLIFKEKVSKRLWGAIGLITIYEFIQLKFTDYLFGRVQFVFIDTSASAVWTSLKYSSVLLLFTAAGYLADKLMTVHRGKNK